MPRRIDLGSPTLNEAFSALRSDYNASKQSRFQRRRAGVGQAGNHADYHFRTPGQFFYAMELSRDLFRNDIVVAQGVRRLVNNVVQSGFRIDVASGDAGLDVELAERWREWSEDADQCDLAGEQSFHGLEKLTLQQTIVDGDVCNLPTVDGPLEQLEAHRLQTPLKTTRNVVYGVLLDERRRRVAYWFTREDVGVAAVSKVGDVVQIPARDDRGQRLVFHAYRPDRASQTRGFTALAPITDTCGIHDDLQFAQLVKAQVASCFAVLEEIPMGMPGGVSSPSTGERSQERRGDGGTRTLEGIGPGMRVQSSPGAKIQGFSPNVPNQEFFPHSMLILTFIAINLGLPVQLLLLDPRQTNFSGWRGAIEQARLGFRDLQQWLIGVLHRPVYRWKVRQWLAADPFLRAASQRAGINVFGHEWHPPRWPYIEPMSDASAHLLRTRNLLTSPRRGAAELGDEWATIVSETVADNGAAIRAAKREAAAINAGFPDDPASWREVLALPTPDRVQTSLVGEIVPAQPAIEAPPTP